jgi:aminopeptidase N
MGRGWTGGTGAVVLSAYSAAAIALMTGVSACGTASQPPVDPEPGISLELAAARARVLTDVHYDLSLDVPQADGEPIAGRAAIRFTIAEPSAIVLDFAPGAANLTSVSIAGAEASYRAVNGHLVLPAEAVRAGENIIDIVFRAGDASLNRNPDYLYSLFVPARAHLAFPCFDQPDIKARFTLALSVPAAWRALTNGEEVSREVDAGRLRLKYATTEPIPTYLFAFAAGAFEIESAQRGGRTYRMLHRETDLKKVARNRDAVFDLHAEALAWLQEYTGIPYRFGKFDFLLAPAFQFSGMEHPGAVYYNANSILLDESATESQMLGRASLIAHETSHMWFGDLVTMRWFDDVWMKEVFANFMAAKMVNPAFPKVDHELRFLTAHYPAAYAVDRTAGTHPIRQPLANLNEAGSLYGPIIYQKAPIVMRQLERLIGADPLRDGLRAYLNQYAFGNATWLDLIRILDERTTHDLAEWSRVWVEEAGRPTVRTELELGPQGRIERLAFSQSDQNPAVSAAKPRQWTQQMSVLVGAATGTVSLPVEMRGERVEVPDAASLRSPRFVLPAGGGLAYGAFTLDTESRAYLLLRLSDLADPLARGAAWVTMWDEMLEGRVAPGALLDLALHALPLETTEQNVQLVSGYVEEIFWRFLAATDRQALAARTETTLINGFRRSVSTSMKATYFSAFRSIVTTAPGLALLERVWRRQERIAGLPLSEVDEAGMALDLAVRSIPSAASVLEEQHRRLTNPDRRARFEFVMPALADSEATRDEFFRRLADAKNRAREPWVLEGLRYLNHPLRAQTAEKHLRPALDLLVEIRQTGDIFFPKNWLDATLGGHRSKTAAATVRQFLAAHPDYPDRLRRIVLQSADDLFRAADRS